MCSNKLLLGRLIAAQFSEQFEGLVLVFLRPRLTEQRLEQLRDVIRPILFRSFAESRRRNAMYSSGSAANEKGCWRNRPSPT